MAQEDMNKFTDGMIVHDTDLEPIRKNVVDLDDRLEDVESDSASYGDSIDDIEDRLGTGLGTDDDDGTDTDGTVAAQLKFIQKKIADGDDVDGVAAGNAQTVYYRAEDSGELDFTKSSYDEVSAVGELKFHPPPSGKIRVVLGGDLKKSGGSWMALSFRLGSKSGDHDVLNYSADRCAQSTSDGYLTFTTQFYVTDLHAGESYYAALGVRNNTKGTGKSHVNRPFLAIEPVLV